MTNWTQNFMFSVYLGLPPSFRERERSHELAGILEAMRLICSKHFRAEQDQKPDLSREAEILLGNHGSLWSVPRRLSMKAGNRTCHSRNLIYPKDKPRLVFYLRTLLEIKCQQTARIWGARPDRATSQDDSGISSTITAQHSQTMPDVELPLATPRQHEGPLEAWAGDSGVPPTDHQDVDTDTKVTYSERSSSSPSPMDHLDAQNFLTSGQDPAPSQNNPQDIAPSVDNALPTIQELLRERNVLGCVGFELRLWGDSVPFRPFIDDVRTPEELFTAFRKVLGLEEDEKLRSRAIVKFKPADIAPCDDFQIARTDPQALNTIMGLLERVKWDRAQDELCAVEFLVHLQT